MTHTGVHIDTPGVSKLFSISGGIAYDPDNDKNNDIHL